MIKDSLKKFFAKKKVINIVSWLAHLYISLVYKTSKIVIKGEYKELIKYIKSGKGLILIGWHGRALVAPAEIDRVFRKKIKTKNKAAVLSSSHRDGKIAAKTIRTFGIKTIEGSTINPRKGSAKNKKSLTSLRNIMKALSEGVVCIVTPDGPRGPGFQINSRTIEIAQMTQAPMACVALSYKRKKIFNTWDFFNLAWPFNTIIIEYGKIIEVKEDEDSDIIRKKFEDSLNSMIKANDIEIKNL